MNPKVPEELDLEALEAAAQEGGPPGSPAQKLMRAIAPANATQPDAKWPSVSAMAGGTAKFGSQDKIDADFVALSHLRMQASTCSSVRVAQAICHV